MKHERFLSHGPVLVCAASDIPGFLLSPRRLPLVKSVLSISDPPGGQNYARPNLHGVRRCVRLSFEDDLDLQAADAPTTADVEAILAWGREFNDFFLGNCGPTPGSKVVIHCYAGRSRSTAAAAMCYAQTLGPGREAEALQLAEKSAMRAGMQPNSLMMLYADRILDRGGALLKAIEPWVTTEKAKPFFSQYMAEFNSAE